MDRVVDLLDGDSFLALAPKKVVETMTVAFAVKLAVPRPARTHIIGRAEECVAHDLRPRIDEIRNSAVTNTAVDFDGVLRTGRRARGDLLDR